MIRVDHVMEVSLEEDRSRVEGINIQETCSKCSNIEEVMKTFESIEVAKWKTKYKDERKKVMWVALTLMISWVFCVCLC